MLGKLLKYEIPALGRKLIPLYAAWGAAAILLGLMIRPSDIDADFFMVLSICLYSAIATAIFVMAIIMIVQRYRNSLLGDEAYFNMVLPVSTSAHIGSKLITSIIWIALSGIVAILTGIIILLLSGNMPPLSEVAYMLAQLDGTTIFCAFEFFILMIAGIVKTVMQIYAAITIGHQARTHVTMASIGAYIGLGVAESFAARLLMLMFPALIEKIQYGYEFATVQYIVLPGLVVTGALAAAYFFICKALMEKRLNLN